VSCAGTWIALWAVVSELPSAAQAKLPLLRVMVTAEDFPVVLQLVRPSAYSDLARWQQREAVASVLRRA
jgi:hypothetical protein